MKTKSLKAAAWAVSVALLALLATTARSQSCSAPGTANIELSVSSKRNATGHWNIAVDARSEQKRRLSARPREGGVEVSVQQRAAQCDSTEAVHLSATASVSNELTPAGYEPIQSLGYYRLSTTACTWLEAVQACAAEGAHLIVLNSDQEANVVREFFARKPNIQNATLSSVLFVGFHVPYGSNNFITVQGLPLNETGYVQWLTGEPLIQQSSYCGTATGEGKLRMTVCLYNLPYICEF